MAGGFLQITPAKQRAALAGKVVDALTSRPIAGAAAVITAGPAAFQRLVALRQAQGGAAPERAASAADGCFAFIALPDGAYTVAISGPAGLHYGAVTQAFSVQRDAAGEIAVTIKVISLPPSGARGTVKAQESATLLPLARVRVEGSGEVAYCDANGVFIVAGLQPGARRLTIGASGYKRGSAAAQIALGQIADLGTITLQPAGA